MKKQLLAVLSIGVALAAFTACKGSATSSTASSPAGGCCAETEALRAQMPNCCAGMLTGSTPTGCCAESLKADAKKKACCVKSDALMGKMSSCCLKAMKGGKPMPCCTGAK